VKPILATAEATIEHHGAAVERHEETAEHHEAAIKHREAVVERHEETAEHHEAATKHREATVERHEAAIEHHVAAIERESNEPLSLWQHHEPRIDKCCADTGPTC
jgi:hypothetical protein